MQCKKSLGVETVREKYKSSRMDIHGVRLPDADADILQLLQTELGIGNVVEVSDFSDKQAAKTILFSDRMPDFESIMGIAFENLTRIGRCKAERFIFIKLFGFQIIFLGFMIFKQNGYIVIQPIFSRLFASFLWILFDYHNKHSRLLY